MSGLGTPWLGLRLDIAYFDYGREERRLPFSETIPFVELDVTTVNRMVSGFLGPQVTGQLGRLRPSVRVGAGLSNFNTTTTLESLTPDEAMEPEIRASTENMDELTFAWTAAGDLAVELWNGGSLYLSVQYIRNGTVRYLLEGGLISNGDGTYSMSIIESSANLYAVQFGLNIWTGLGD